MISDQNFTTQNSGFFILGKYFFDPVLSWFIKSYPKFVFHFPAIRLVTLKKTLKSDRLLRYVNKSHQLEPIRLQGSPLISKRM